MSLYLNGKNPKTNDLSLDAIIWALMQRF